LSQFYHFRRRLRSELAIAMSIYFQVVLSCAPNLPVENCHHDLPRDTKSNNHNTSVSTTSLFFTQSTFKSEPSIDMDARASYSENIANYCRQAITNIQHPQPKSHAQKIPEVVENLEQVAQQFKRQIDLQNRIRMFTDNLHAQCRFDTTKQVLAKMREHRKILEKKDEEIRNQNELIRRLQDQSVNQQATIDNMKLRFSADRQSRINEGQEIARLKQELVQKDQLISQQALTIKDMYHRYQIAENQFYDLQMANHEPRDRLARPREADDVLHVAQDKSAQTADGVNVPKDQSKVLKASFEEPASAIRGCRVAQGANHEQVEEINVLVKKVEDLDIKWIERKKEMREGDNQVGSVGSLRMELSGEIEATSEDPNKVTGPTTGGAAIAPRPELLATTTNTPEVEDAKVENCILKAEDLYSAD
jgi:hypothetical protein